MQDLEALKTVIVAMERKLDMLVSALLGDPTDKENPGMLIRLDRLERSNATMKRVLTAFGTGLIAVIGTIGAAFIIQAMS